MKKDNIFAMFKTKNRNIHFGMIANFFATYLRAIIFKDKRAIKSVQSCYISMGNCSWSNTGAIASLIYLYFHSVMTKNNENTSKVKYSSHTCTPTERNTVPEPNLQQKFLIEKNAKNKAYAFILSHGLLNAFAEFTHIHANENYHQLCVTILDNQSL